MDRPHLPGRKQLLTGFIGFAVHRPHSESHSWKGYSGKGASDGGNGMQRFLLIKAKNDRIAGVANGGGVNPIVSEYKVVVKVGILFNLGSNSVHEVNVKGN